MRNPRIGNINHSLTLNKPGVCQVFFVDTEKVLSAPDLLMLMRNSSNVDELLSRSLVDLKLDENWHDFVNDFSLWGLYSYDDKASAQGTYTSFKVTVPVPHDQYESHSKTFNAMRDKQFLVFVMLKDKSCRLLGTVERGCDFDRKFTTGNHKGASRNDLTFSWDSDINPLYYKNPFLDELYMDASSLAYDCFTDFEFGITINNLSAPTVLTIQFFDEVQNKWIDIKDVTATTNGYTDFLITPYTFEQNRIYHLRAKAKTLGIISSTYSVNPTLYCS